MAAYVIAKVVNTGDKGWRAEYRPKLAPLVERHGGKFLVRGRAPKELLEGKEGKVVGHHRGYGVPLDGGRKGLVQ